MWAEGVAQACTLIQMVCIDACNVDVKTNSS
jgi:hypothetical protein